MSEKRYLILAEGRSGDPHYGKTARGVIRYSPNPSVAVVDSTRPGETLDGVPVFGDAYPVHPEAVEDVVLADLLQPLHVAFRIAAIVGL